MSHLSKGWSICQKVGPFVKRLVHLSKGWSICQKVRSICQKGGPFVKRVVHLSKGVPEPPITILLPGKCTGPRLCYLTCMCPTWKMHMLVGQIMMEPHCLRLQTILHSTSAQEKQWTKRSMLHHLPCMWSLLHQTTKDCPCPGLEKSFQ